MKITHIEKVEQEVFPRVGDIIVTHNAKFMITKKVEKTTTGYNSDLSFTAVNLTQDTVIYGIFKSPQEVFNHFLHKSYENKTSRPRLIEREKVELRIGE